MKKLVFTNDFLFHDFSNTGNYHGWIFDLFLPVIKSSVCCESDEFKFLKNKGKNFSREKFFELSGIKNLEQSYFCYDFNKISDESVEYLKGYIDENIFILGIELSENLRKILDKLNCKYINIAFHSFKLFDDLPLLFNTNDRRIFEILGTYKIPEEKFKFYTDYWKVYLNVNKLTCTDLEANSALFVGQLTKDMSVEDKGKFYDVTDYKDYLKALCKEHSCVYYLPHPMLGKDKKKYLVSFLKQFENVKILENRNSYAILSSPAITKVVGISSSLLYEAKYFQKKTEYLLHPLYYIDSEFGLNSYISVYNEFFTPLFWQKLLENDFETFEGFCEENYFAFASNKFRNLKNLYWAYADLDEVQMLKKEVSSLKKAQKHFFKIEYSMKYTTLYVFGLRFNFKRNRNAG